MCLLMFCVLAVNAQFVTHGRHPSIKHKIDTCNYSVVYYYKFVRDTIQKNEYFDRQILEVSDSIVKYSSIYADKIDSVHVAFSNKKNRPNKSGADGYNPGKEAGMKSNETAIYADYYTNYPRRGVLTVSTGVWGKEYVYEEPIPKFEWEIQSDTATILGYKCIKATTTFRGRTYNAWFTLFIPMRYGPWKFSGLPGLILKVSDTKEYFEWTAIGIEQSRNRSLDIIDFDRIPKSLVRTDRKDVIKLLHKRWNDPVGLGFANLSQTFKGSYSITDPLTGKTARISYAMPVDKNVQFPYIPIPELE